MADQTDHSATTQNRTGAFAPFASRGFLVLWFATVLSNIGTWMHDVGAGWLMTSLTSSTVFVAMVQTATTLPIFLFALPAGALADIVDKRKLLISVQIMMGLAAFGLGYVVAVGQITPTLLLLFTFIMGIGAALTAPAWQAIVPNLVPKELLQQAVAINSVGINISRALGPAIGGIILGYSLSLPFFLNALSFTVVVCALFWWKPESKTPSLLPSESLFSAMRVGVRYALHSTPLKATLIRAISFFLFASAYWSLLPLIARDLLNGDANFYGLMMGAVGLGAVSGAFILPSLKSRFSADLLVAAGTVGTAICMVVLATITNPVIAIGCCFIAGASWLAVLTSLNVSAQVALPEWVRARGLAVFVTVFFGGMSIGSLIWGGLSGVFGIDGALIIASVCSIAAIPLSFKHKLQVGAQMNLAPSMHWPQPIIDPSTQPDRGPVMVTIEYLIKPENRDAFLLEIYELREHRYRDGAYSWGLFEDTEAPGRYLEYFLVESWLEHMRQHARVTHSDAAIQKAIKALHDSKEKPAVHHYIAVNTIKKGTPPT